MSENKLSPHEVDEFVNVLGLGDGKTLLQSMASAYYRGEPIQVIFWPVDGLPVSYAAKLEKPIAAPPAAEAPCPKCSQVLPGEPGIGGEYPCAVCGVPTSHDAEAVPE